jgi:peptidoglycan lytic transglycosylase
LRLYTNKRLLITLLIVAVLAMLLPIWKNTYAKTKATGFAGSSDLLARLIRAEAESEPYTGQVAVGAVILNRIQNPRFPKSLAGVIYQPHAFESVSNGQVNLPATESCRKAARAAMGGWDPSGGALFFYNPAKVASPSSYVWTRHIIQKIGKHFFAQ